MRSEYAHGARNAVRACLNVGANDRVAVIKDKGRLAIAEAIEEEARAAGAEVRSWQMEDLIPRPAREFPRRLAEEILAFEPSVSYFIGEGLEGELAFRQPMLELLRGRLRCRHGHMIGIDHQLMLEGMAGDYEEIYSVTRRVWEVARQASKIEVATRLGTELTATFSPSRRWVPCDGRYWEQGQWGNLPEGETFTAPLSVDGVLVGEELGDHFAPKYGLLPEPISIRVRDSRVVSVELSSRPELVREVEAYFGQHPNSNRVGEFAIGTNTGLRKIVGNFLQDEKFPGVHVAFGDPYGSATGADWSCPSHVDVLASQADVWVDGRKVMEAGRFQL
ncbi:MAG: aminopeptidase [Candidatus Dormibacteraeota bacterium]|uniref:Aminopeptidase n=1 Tax=Candidatus Dormiibacter inghamiae TaxID=3127013 RepID=A0A934NCD2_9BACT|nr:aminopeptidase [Candidatus Dormibacteraeota bacterium]MBJ7606985.1 aminopeptidase [Candidatus Dormibacteraeota bacterium]